MRLAEWSCYATALPQLDAAQTLRRAEAAALPWLPPPDRRRTLTRLRRALDVPDSTAPIEIPGLPIRHVPTRQRSHQRSIDGERSVPAPHPDPTSARRSVQASRRLPAPGQMNKQRGGARPS
jgi:hypothetical protein